MVGPVGGPVWQQAIIGAHESPVQPTSLIRAVTNAVMGRFRRMGKATAVQLQ